MHLGLTVFNTWFSHTVIVFFYYTRGVAFKWGVE